MAVATQTELELIVEAILERIAAQGVVLFGSQARHEASEHSDIDLLIVASLDAMAGTARHEILGKIYRDVADIPIGIDLLLYTPEEVDARRDSLNHVIAHALREGRILHGHA